MKKDKMTDRLK